MLGQITAFLSRRKRFLKGKVYVRVEEVGDMQPAKVQTAMECELQSKIVSSDVHLRMWKSITTAEYRNAHQFYFIVQASQVAIKNQPSAEKKVPFRPSIKRWHRELALAVLVLAIVAVVVTFVLAFHSENEISNQHHPRGKWKG